MVMLTRDDPLINQLSEVAQGARLAWDEKSFRVEQAMDLDSAFRSGQARSGLERDIIKQGMREAATRAGLTYNDVGDLFELVASTGGTLRRFRFKRVRRAPGGRLRLLTSSESILAVDEPESLLPRPESWVIVVIFTKLTDQIETIEVAEVIDVVGDSVRELVVRNRISLDDVPSGVDLEAEGFQGDDEDLDLGDDDIDGYNDGRGTS